MGMGMGMGTGRFMGMGIDMVRAWHGYGVWGMGITQARSHHLSVEVLLIGKRKKEKIWSLKSA